jgi:hypothetical protein
MKKIRVQVVKTYDIVLEVDDEVYAHTVNEVDPDDSPRWEQEIEMYAINAAGWSEIGNLKGYNDDCAPFGEVEAGQDGPRVELGTWEVANTKMGVMRTWEDA